jgi:hypothetical protein
LAINFLLMANKRHKLRVMQAAKTFELDFLKTFCPLTGLYWLFYIMKIRRQLYLLPV